MLLSQLSTQVINLLHSSIFHGLPRFTKPDLHPPYVRAAPRVHHFFCKTLEENCGYSEEEETSQIIVVKYIYVPRNLPRKRPSISSISLKLTQNLPKTISLSHDDPAIVHYCPIFGSLLPKTISLPYPLVIQRSHGKIISPRAMVSIIMFTRNYISH